MSYSFWKVRRNKETNEIESKLFDIASESDLGDWIKDNPNWHDSKKDLSDAEEKGTMLNPTKKEKTVSIGDGELELTEDQLKIIVRLLKGEQINTRRGLSLTSFGNLFGINYNDRANQKRIKPKYDILMKQLTDKDEIKKVRKAWYYKNAVVRGRSVDKRKKKVIK